ncbi:MAG: efflux RND transporter permease subunit, partial [Rhodocyclaceae bacterium]|nr:efflux RND transporter permease subunit [Rhodocyclaceae bacterium]
SVTLAAAIVISMIISLTTTPSMCAWMLSRQSVRDEPKPRTPGTGLLSRFASLMRRMQRAMMRGYRHSLAWSLRHRPLMMLVLLATIGLNVYLYATIKKGFFPQQDTGRVMAMIQADQSISFQAMQAKMQNFMRVINADPAVANVNGYTGGNRGNSSQLFITLKPIGDGADQRRDSAEVVINRLRPKLSREPGANVFLVAMQDIRVGGRQSNAQYQYALQGDDLDELREWEPKIRNAFSKLPELTDVNTDFQDRATQIFIDVDRDKAAQLGLNMRTIDSALSSAFSQRQVGIIYNPLNQYRVVLGLAPEWLQSPESLRNFYVTSNTGAQVPLSAFARLKTSNAPLQVNHQAGFPADTFSFNLPPGVSLGQASDAINQTMAEIGVPTSIQGSFAGTAKAFEESNRNQPLLILAAIITIYIVLGMLYESLLHPLTIISTLPSAGVGALLALMATKTEFSFIALIGVILLIGIVKKNAILMIDVAIAQQRQLGCSPAVAIYRACQLRFRPILMTTVAAICGAIPLAIGSGDGAELRNPLGIAIVGGLLMSQLLTLYTTPVVYVMLDRLRSRFMRKRNQPVVTLQTM